MTSRHVALTIAGSDSGGGAGIQADLKTFQAFGVFGTTAITAITAQNTVGVRAIQKIDPEVVADQIRAVADDLKPAAAKTGMLADAPIIEAVAGAIRETGLGHLVVDPVMVAKSGDRLLEEDAVSALATQLLPLSEVLTPNLPEAAILAGRPVETPADMRAAAEILWHEWQEARLETRHTHGTGCTLSAAICAGLALGLSRVEAVQRARGYTRRAIETAPGLGKGHGPLNHLVVGFGDGNSGIGESGIR
jgi:hydroxymethylpyrimidine/phosphomethylpyrimidine kinase